MERIYDSLQRITLLWKKLELTKPNASEYDAIMGQIRALSEEYWALIEVPKNPKNQNEKGLRHCQRSGLRVSQARGIGTNCN